MKRWLVAVALCCGCGAAPEPQPRAVSGEPPSPDRTVVKFLYQTLEGKPVSHAAYRGRMTLIVFVATYDSASQAQARFVEALYRKHTPRINALMLVLEPPENKIMVETFVDVLDLHFDVAFADPETIEGQGPFQGLHHVPSIVLLDRDGHEVWRNLGVVDDRTLGEVIADHDPRD
jgi:hypothetical protein